VPTVAHDSAGGSLMTVKKYENVVHAPAKTGLSRTYVVEGRNRLMAVDVGSVGAAKDVMEFVTNRLGRSLKDVKTITATHFHIDHIGGINALLEQCGHDTRVIFHHLVRDYLDGVRKPSLIHHWATGLMPATVASVRNVHRLSHFAFAGWAGIPLPIIRTMTGVPFDRSRIIFVGDGRERRYDLDFDGWSVIETPGHTEDSITFYHDKSAEMICGDLIINTARKGKGVVNRFYWNRQAIRDSYYYLCRETAPVVIYPGHGDIITGTGDVLGDVAFAI